MSSFFSFSFFLATNFSNAVKSVFAKTEIQRIIHYMNERRSDAVTKKRNVIHNLSFSSSNSRNKAKPMFIISNVLLLSNILTENIHNTKHISAWSQWFSHRKPKHQFTQYNVVLYRYNLFYFGILCVHKH